MLICQPQGVKRSIVDGLIVSGGASFFVCFFVFQSVGKWDKVHAAEGKTDRQPVSDACCFVPACWQYENSLFLVHGDRLLDDSSFYSTF